MAQSEVSVFVDRSARTDFRSSRQESTFTNVIEFGTVRVIALFTDVAKADFFFALIFEVEMITIA